MTDTPKCKHCGYGEADHYHVRLFVAPQRVSWTAGAIVSICPTATYEEHE